MIHNDSRILLSVCGVVSLMTQITETGYERYTTMQYVLYQKQDKHNQCRAAVETTACKQIEHFLSSMYNLSRYHNY